MSEKLKTLKERILDRIYAKSEVSTVSEYEITEREVNTKVVKDIIDEEFEGWAIQIKQYRDEAIKEARKHANMANDLDRGKTRRQLQEDINIEDQEKLRFSSIALAYNKVLVLLVGKEKQK